MAKGHHKGDLELHIFLEHKLCVIKHSIRFDVNLGLSRRDVANPQWVARCKPKLYQNAVDAAVYQGVQILVPS
eukprot:1634813-Amphidinium_carterae.1